MESSLSGRRIGAFEIGPLIGEGGMGQVYRARDTRLNRDVAIKVLLPAVALDRERLARFEREAQTLASLNHPNIAHIHGVEQGPDGPVLVLEFVDGPTLADRIAGRPLPLDEATAIARQIADALEAAHERGIIHRDLKPANIKVNDDGAVKVLDFGLAKAIDHDLKSSGLQGGDIANSPTITSPATQAGVILGTAAYMSPEQAKGRAVDKRSDVWAFGCVLYEMLSGTRAFGGEDVTDTIAAVVRGEPDWSALPAGTPASIRRLLKGCLEKDRRARVGDASVARFLMHDARDTADAPDVASGRASRTWWFAAAGVLTGAAIVGGAWAMAPRAVPASATTVRFAYTPPAELPFATQGNDRDLAMSPDGSVVVYRSGNRDTMLPRLAIRGVGDSVPRELPGTEGARFPFFSADGRSVGFFFGAELRTVPLAGGPSVTVCAIPGSPRGASWGPDGTIVFSSIESGELLAVPATGGKPSPLKMAGVRDGESVGMPHFLPGGKALLFTSFNARAMTVSVDALDVPTGSRKRLINGALDASYLQAGYLVYSQAGPSGRALQGRVSLFAIRFDASRLETSGEPMALIDDVMPGNTGTVNYSTNLRGDLAYVQAGTAGDRGPVVRSLVWVDRKGSETPVGAPDRPYAMARLSPDGARIALDVRDQQNDIHIWDVPRRTLSLLNRSIGQDMSPIWTPDGRRVLWTSTRHGGNPNFYAQPADGSVAASRVTTNVSNQFPTSFTPDGKTVVLFGARGTQTDIFTVNLNEQNPQQRSLLAQPGFEFGGEISPDGKWIAYYSNESGEFQVYVRPFPNVDGGRTQISSNGGTRVMWARNGRELFYLDEDGLLMSVAVQTSPAFSAGAPVKLLNTAYYQGSTVLGLHLRSFDVSTDGQRFLMIKDPQSQPAAEPQAGFNVVLNWASELQRRLPASP